MPRLALPAVVVPLLIVLVAPRGHAADPCEPVAARIVSLQGLVEVQAAGSAQWTVATLEDGLCIGDTLRVGVLSRAALDLPDNPVLRLDQHTTLRLVGTTESGSSWLDLLVGVVHFFSRRPHALRIDTPVANAGTEGTEFLMRVAEGRTEVVMFEGRVRLTTPQGELLVASGDAAVALAGAAPARQIVVRPRDAVAWALYYPPVLAPLAGQGAAPAPLPPGLERALARVAANDYAGALAALDEVPPAARDARYLTYRAGVLLNVGRVDAAEAVLAQAQALDPAAGEALAQRAVLRVAQNRREEALADATRSVELSPGSAPARIALSYALQASFELEAARAALREAVERSPDDALAWARFAELEQSFGELGAAQAAAERAVALAPGLGRTQMVLGFAALTRIEIDQAKAAFARAIELDSTLPLARLGQGLARIRAGDLGAGARDLEIAVALDPDASLLRSYLGKAYFEQRRGPLDAAQFQIAKELDPNDPTPWFYDAIRLQTENRPVEALRSLERSIALNDNRAVYRSRLLLDQDLATRQASLARIYDDLGFEQLGALEASKSLSTDPANSSAHRFLSDTYAALPRHEIARVSELLQSQLLQPLNLNPVQPSLPLTDLNAVAGAGPAEVAFNEFTPLFARNGAQLTATGLVGSQHTLGDEVVVSGLWNRWSLSGGQFHSETDGFRPNNDVQNDLYDLFGQVSVSPELSLQAEYRHRDTDQGDLLLNFDPSDFAAGTRRSLNEDVARVGLRYSPALHSDLLLSVFYVDSEEDNVEVTGLAPGVDIAFGGTTEDRGYQAEAQYLFRTDRLNLIAGGALYDLDVRQRLDADPCLVPTGCLSDTRFERQQQKAYGYINWRLPEELTWTLGLSIDSFEEDRFDRDRVNPKLGVQLQATERLRLRAAYFRTLKPALSIQQTLEPTQVAGFNQLFDDINGTTAEAYVLGAELRLTDTVAAGVEFRHRDLDEPIADRLEQREEALYRTYLYWAPHPRWSATAELRYETFDQKGAATSGFPRQLDQLNLPLVLRHFRPNGLFGQVGATFLHQDVERFTGNEGEEDVLLLDAAVGLRLPERRGIISLEGRNLLDTNFAHQDLNLITSERRASPLIPERVVLARLTLSF